MVVGGLWRHLETDPRKCLFGQMVSVVSLNETDCTIFWLYLERQWFRNIQEKKVDKIIEKKTI